MEKVFVDTNILINLVEKRDETVSEKLAGKKLYLSPLSVHILLYVTKKKIPYITLTNVLRQFILLPFDESITKQALEGPTNDFEDNVQLHSSAQADCDLFLTEDKELLAMKFFGKARVLSPNGL